MIFPAAINAHADPLSTHFLGANPTCSAAAVPVLLVTDVTRSGEIDDSISLHIYRELEKAGCIQIVGVASIFGNGGSSTGKVHENLIARLTRLGINQWPVFEGPSKKFPFAPGKPLIPADREKLQAIAAAANTHDRLVIAELGPFTVSASLLGYKFLEPSRIAKILGVGGRTPGERFSMKGGLPFAFRDMNVAEDRAAIGYLVRNHSSKLWLVTYKSGLGERMIQPELVASFGDSEMATHAKTRARRLEKIGYGGKIPSWDTWTSAYFIAGGAERLNCGKMRARMAYSETGYRTSDMMQLQLTSPTDGRGTLVDACH